MIDGMAVLMQIRKQTLWPWACERLERTAVILIQDEIASLSE